VVRKTLVMVLCAFGACLAPSLASAGTLECPNDAAMGLYTRQYAVTTTPTPLDCVYGDGNLNGQANDGFLDPAGNINDGGGDPLLGGGWTSFSSTVGANTIGLTCWTSAAKTEECTWGETSGGYFEFAGVGGFDYALGVKDGGDPKWAVFLLPTGVFNGLWDITTGNGISHLVLYDRQGGGSGTGSGSGQAAVPEPASLMLLGTGLGIAASRLRRRGKRNAERP
jgi:PEP-CTERM motif-containing protein